MKTLRFIWIGKLKEDFWRGAAEHYWMRLGRFFRLEEICVKDGAAAATAVRIQDESARLVAQLRPQDRCICLDEQGKARSSQELADAVAAWTTDGNRTSCFVIGGPFGLGSAVLERCAERLSLSKMTLPHEMARVVLLEQLYRAATILKGMPYHHA